MSDALTFAVLVAFLAAGVIEATAEILWWPWFFRSTPCLWRAHVSPRVVRFSSEVAIAGEINNGIWRPMLFRRLSDTEVAFRESFGSFRPARGISGLISEVSSGVTITARCSWFIMLGLALAARGALVEHAFGAACLGAVMASLLVAQRQCVLRMVRAVEDQGA
jgi:hypothetical protein